MEGLDNGVKYFSQQSQRLPKGLSDLATWGPLTSETIIKLERREQDSNQESKWGGGEEIEMKIDNSF